MNFISRINIISCFFLSIITKKKPCLNKSKLHLRKKTKEKEIVRSCEPMKNGTSEAADERENYSQEKLVTKEIIQERNI